MMHDRKEYDGFVQNYNMHNMGKTVTELHAMLKLHEQTFPPKDAAPALHAIKQEGSGKTKRRNRIRLLRGIKGKAKQRWGMHLCLLHFLLPNPRILQHPRRIIQQRTRFATNVVKESRKLKPGALSLYVGDCHRATVEAIREFHLCHPSGLDDIYEIDLSSSNTNDSSMYDVSNKRAKLNLDSTLLWHYRLGHISKKRIEKLQHDGLLDSTEIKSFEKCVSCMSGSMARKPYSYQVERAKDLLGLIHTDVCGPFRTVSRQGASYFVTFTDDFSRYGYVYLLKHKHEVFETFKVC
ncbi:retrotransposon protein, putative, ty1-copia subclass [Tanacetum coccineum]